MLTVCYSRKNIEHHLLFTKKCFNVIIKLKLSQKTSNFGVSVFRKNKVSMLDFFFINDMHLGKRQFSEETTLQF